MSCLLGFREDSKSDIVCFVNQNKRQHRSKAKLGLIFDNKANEAIKTITVFQQTNLTHTCCNKSTQRVI